MADARHGPAFWRSVARAFRGDPGVVFDLYNEPKRLPWRCWRDGCEGYAGMQDLVDAVRSTGARQPVIADGLNYSNDLSGWLAHAPVDPLRQLAAGFHTYGDLPCRGRRCWDRVVGRVTGGFPVVTGEVGEFDCASRYLDRYLPWADANGVSYLAWAWNSHDCAREPSLLRSRGGAPSRYGLGFRDHLAGLDS
jgi:endoglucanase